MPPRRLLLAASLVLAACGGESIPSGNSPPPGEKTLAPLGTGARWTYRVSDPLHDAPFEKVVEVAGPAQIPDSAATAILVVDSEPTQEERSWLVSKDGLVLRAREEDWKAGVLVRKTTWTPGAPKTLAADAPVGWTHRATVSESEWSVSSGVTEVKDQIYEFKVVATNVQVTVPAGTFDCLKVTRVRIDKPSDPMRTYWLAPDVGKVREEGERTEELVDYTPAP
jgi:hypothetical protein